jgi:TonB-linked SusC/RagA family outer membrane protein
MRKVLLCMLFFGIALFYTAPLMAQTKVVSGVISTQGDNTTLLRDVTVRVKGTRLATSSNQDGRFSIQASKGQVLVFSSIGYETKEVTVGNNDEVNVSLTQANKQMEEVVVTAMDRKLKARELGYSVQTVKGSDIQQTQRENFVNSLQGRVAGLTVTPTTGAAGASSGIVLRGYNTISGTNQPLFVVDGIILDNQTFNSNSQGGSGIGLASDGNNRSNDNTNRIADLNPNDIENVTVLKGPEATALYGSQASSGAIVITTKKAKNTNGKINLQYDDNFRFQKITRFSDVNNDYGPGGSNYNPNLAPSSTSFTSFGPKWAPGTQLFDNVHNFFKTGFSQTHNLSADFGKKNVAFRATGQIFDNSGVIPFNTYKKYNIKLANTTKIGKYITITPTVSYISAENAQPLKGSSGYLVNLYEWPANNDIRNYQDSAGGKLLLFSPVRNSDFDNPLWGAKNNHGGDKLNRFISTMGIDINPFSWLTLAGRFGYDTYKDNGYIFTHPSSYILTAKTGGSLDNYYRTYTGYNHTITANAKKAFGDLTTSLLVGTMWQDYETKQFAVYGTNLIDSTSTDSSNTTVNTRRRLLQNYNGKANLSIFREFAYFGEVSFGYKNYAFLTYSHRFEKASPIPTKNNNYNYPGASLSLIVSDMFPFLKKGNILTYAKLRGSLANTARLNDPYTNQSNFGNNFSSTVLPVTYTYAYTNANPELKPEKQKTYDIGTELRFLKDKLSLEVDYYNTLCTDQIAQGFRASYATGFILNTQNAASLRNQGIEATLIYSPIVKKDFNWTINFNFSHMWSKVLSLPASIDVLKDFYNSDTYISNARAGLIRGNSTGTITGSTYQRNTNGDILINPSTGYPLIQTGNSLIADRTPDFTLGTLNSFRYKNWTLSFLWDLKVGGDIYNGTDQLLTKLGKSGRTTDRATPITIKGVLADGNQNSANPTPNKLAIVPQYLSFYYSQLPDEEFIQKNVNWFRLRDLTLSYTFTQRTMQHIKAIKSLSAFVTGSDLILITNYYGADPAVNANNPGTGGVGGYGLDLGNAPTPLGISFGLRASF